MHLETTGGLNTNSPYCLRLDAEDATTGKLGVANDGFWGIGLKSGAVYDLTLYARGGDGFAGNLSAFLEDASGGQCSDIVNLRELRADWQAFKAMRFLRFCGEGFLGVESKLCQTTENAAGVMTPSSKTMRWR